MAITKQDLLNLKKSIIAEINKFLENKFYKLEKGQIKLEKGLGTLKKDVKELRHEVGQIDHKLDKNHRAS